MLPWMATATASALCDAELRTTTLPVEIEVPPGHWLQARLIEDGSDWVLMAAAGGWRLQTDTAPSRLAVERLTLPGSLFPMLAVDARPWSGDPDRKPALQYNCGPWVASLMPSLNLMWSGAWLVKLEGSRNATAVVRLDHQARDHLRRVLDDTATPAEMATAQHTLGYLLTTNGHRHAAASAFDAASGPWALAGHPGAQLAARFHAAQARLNGGAVTAAARALDDLGESGELERWPFLRDWIANDRCLARRELGDWDGAAACFAELAQHLSARGLAAESAMARCNRLAALAGGQRWHEARDATADCVSHQFASGSNRGRAQALHLRGWVRLRFGEIQSGIQDLAAALELLDQSSDSPMAWQVRSLLAGAWLVLDEAPRAIAMLQAGLAQFPAARDPATHARLTHELGLVERWAQTPQAAVTLGSARDRYQALGWTRLQRDVECELASAGWGAPPDECAVGLARADLAAGRAAEALRRTQSATAGSDWSTALEWLELAVDATFAGADAAVAESLLQQLIERSRTLDAHTELTRRMRAAVSLELAGAAAALVVAGGRRELAGHALTLLRSVGPPLSSARSVLYGASAISSTDRATLSATIRAPAPTATLPTGIAELGYLRFGARAFWLVARADQVRVMAAPDDARMRLLEQQWREALDQLADPATLERIGRSIADEIALADLVAEHDRLWLTHFSGPTAELAWSALPRERGERSTRLGYAPLGTTLAVIAAAGDVDPNTAMQPVRVSGLAGLIAADLPIELAGSRNESADLAELAQSHGLSLHLLSLADLTGPRPVLPADSLLLLSGHAAADRQLGELTALRLGSDSALRWGAPELESWRSPPAILILGACESASGPQRRYFGDFGLASAASRSGARWVLGHRWPIDDQAAANLHRSFIAALLEGRTPGDSLIVAQQTLADSRRFSHPRHWAGATLIHNSSGASSALPELAKPTLLVEPSLPGSVAP